MLEVGTVPKSQGAAFHETGADPARAGPDHVRRHVEDDRGAGPGDLRQTLAEKIEPMLAKAMEFATHLAPQLAALA